MDRLLRYLVLSDIHANLEALDTVLDAAGAVDHVLALGDFIGYGADPNAVIARIRALPAVTVIRGNHDKVGVGLESSEGFNYLARHAIAWTASALSTESRDWVAALPQGPLGVSAEVEICHGAPFDEDVYVFDDLDAMRALRASSHPLCLFGHTHVPTAFRLETSLRVIGPPRGERFTIKLDGPGKYLVNCGAVGQPRDGDPRAAFGLLDTDAHVLEIRRVAYNVAAAQAKIIAAGLPEVLGQRLAAGR